MGYRHTKDDILEGALAAVLDEGLSRLTFGRLAKRLGISDRIVVYYFPSKSELVAEVLAAVGVRLQEALAPVMADPFTDHREFIRAAWPVLATPEADPVFALFFEAGGLAAAGVEPYAAIVPGLMSAWVEWAEGLLVGTKRQRRREAAAAIATIDGLLLLRQLGGREVADLAARAAVER